MAMTLSAVMNLTGNFVAQVQKNTEAIQGMAQQAKQAGDTIKNSLSQNIGEKLSSGLSVAKDALGAAGIASAGFLKGCVDGAAKAQKVNADLAQTIKSTGGAAGLTADEVSKMASEMSKTNLASAGMIKDGDNMLLTFTNIGKDVFPQASQAMVDLAQKMGGAPKDTAIQLGKALNDPTTGLTALTRVGITFTDQQKNQIKTMQAAGDMAGAQKIIIGELNKEFGGQSAAALNTYDGKMQKLTQTVGGIKSSIGSVLLPYLMQVAEKLNSGAQAVSSFASEHKQLIAVVLSLTAVFGTLIGGASLFSHLSAFLGPTIQAIMRYLKDLPIPIFTIIAVIGLLVAAYTTNFMGFKDFIDGVVAHITSAFQSATKVFKDSGSAIQAVAEFISQLFGGDAGEGVTIFYNNIQEVVVGICATVKEYLPQAKAMVMDVFGGIVQIWNSILKPVLLVIIGAVYELAYQINMHLPQIKAVISAVFEGIAIIWNSVLKPVFSVIISVIGSLVSWFIAHIPQMLDIITGVFNGIKDIVTSVWNVIGPTIMGAVTRIVSFFSSTIPHLWTIIQVVFYAILAFVGPILIQVYMIIAGALGFIAGAWKGIWGMIGDYLKFIWDEITGVISIAWDVISGVIKVALDLLSGNFKQAGTDFLDIFRNLWQDIKSLFGNLATDAISFGKDFIEGLIGGIKGAIGGVKDAVVSVADTIKSYLHFSVPDVGPLTDYESWMPDFMKGMGNGIKVNTHLVTDPIKDVAVGIKTNTLNGLSGGVPQMKSQTVTNNNKNNTAKSIQIAKLADQIIIREEADIDKFATAFANKLYQTELGMA